MSLGGLPGSLRLNVSDVSVSQGPAPLCLTASPSQCLRCLSVSGPCPPLSHSLAVTMSQCLYVSWGVCLGQRGNVSMSQCLRGVCLGQHGASQCLNVSGGLPGPARGVSMSQLSRRGLPGPARGVSMSQLSRRGLPGPARSVSTSQCLSCLGGVCLGQFGALNVSMSQLSQGGFAWASSARLNVSMSQGGLPGGDQDQRSRVSMSQCLREVCLGGTRTSAAASQCLSASGRSAWGRPGPA